MNISAEGSYPPLGSDGYLWVWIDTFFCCMCLSAASGKLPRVHTAIADGGTFVLARKVVKKRRTETITSSSRLA